MKIKRELVYKKGLAIVLTQIEEEASEYKEDRNYGLRLYFKSKNAINNACKILGYKLDKKRTVEAFERGRNGFDVYLDSMAYYILQSTFGASPHIGGDGYYFSYNNHYSDNRLSERVNPKNIFDNIDERSLETYLGSCANSDGNFRDYLEGVLARLESGSIYYCPSI